MPRWPWIDRTFDFSFPAAKFPDLLERVRGTAPRIEAMVAGLPDNVLARSNGRNWSIKQNIGHLTDLEYLPHKRIDQILAGERTLVAADMSNRRTHEANHNDQPIETLLSAFRSERARLVEKLEAVSPDDWGKSAMHPRLNRPMRIVDIACFHGEHDDYHLARIRELIGRFT